MIGHLLTFGRLSRLTISEYGWILFGFMLMLPFEVFTAGFFLAYLLIIMLVASSVEIPKVRLVLFILMPASSWGQRWQVKTDVFPL